MSFDYFNKLNYSLANEDNALEAEIIRYYKAKNVVCVGGSGARVFPLLHPEINSIQVCDLSEDQIDLIKLKEKLFNVLGFNEYLIVLGHKPDVRRSELVHQLTQNKLFSIKELNFLNTKDNLLLDGKWESSFLTLHRLVKLFLGDHCEKVFSHESMDEQYRYFENKFPWRRFNLLIRLLGNKTFFDAILYKGHFVKKNIEMSYFEHYSNAFKRLFIQIPTKNSFFLQLIFLGEIRFLQGSIAEVRPLYFNDAQEKLKTLKIEYINKNVIEHIAQQKNLDFISMSNVPSYFSGQLEKEYLQMIRPGLAPGAIIVLRFYLRIPKHNETGFVDVTPLFSENVRTECVQMYHIKILKYVG